MMLRYFVRSIPCRAPTSSFGLHTLVLHGAAPSSVRNPIAADLSANCGAMPVQNSDQLTHTFTRDKLKHAVWAASKDPLDVSASKALLTSALKAGTVKEIKLLRSMLATDPFAKTLVLDEDDVADAVRLCNARGDAEEGVQWMLLANTRGISLPEPVRAALLQEAYNTMGWDSLNWLIQEMRDQGQSIPNNIAARALQEAATCPNRRWRQVSALLGEDPAALPAEALASGFQCLVNAGQQSICAEVYAALAQRARTAAKLAWCPPQLLPPVGLAAQQLDRFDLLQSALVDFSSGRWGQVGPCEVAASTVEDETAWLLGFVNQVVLGGGQDCVLQSGSAIGVVLGWLFHRGQTAMATQIWNDYTDRIRKCSESSLLDETERSRGAVMEVLRTLTRLATTQSLEFAPRASTASFLRGVLVSLDASAGQRAEGVSARQAPPALDLSPLLEDLVAVYSSLQDMPALSSLLVGQLAKGALVSDKIMCRSLEVFQKYGDHSLALELFSLYLRITDPRNPKRAEKVHGKSVGLKGKARFTATKSVLRTTLSPPLFGVAITSFVETGKLDSMMAILDQELPARGFIPRTSCYLVAMEALIRHGKYSEATVLFGRSQALYAQLSRDSQATVKRAIPLNYGVYAEQLLDTALRSCAKGRLGLKALEIFNDWARALRRGEVMSKPSDIAPLVNHVATSLADPQYVTFLPQFMGSLNELHVGLSVPRRALVTALAAATTFQDATTVDAVVALIEEVHGCPVNDVISRERLWEEVRRISGDENGEAALTFANTYDALRKLL